MRLFKYNQFVSSRDAQPINESYSLVNENFDMSVKMFKTGLTWKKAAEKGGFLTPELKSKSVLTVNDFTKDQRDAMKPIIQNKEVSVTPEEIKSVMSNDPNFQTIVQKLGRQSGLIHPFAYFHFVEGVPLEELIGPGGLFDQLRALNKEQIMNLKDEEGNVKPFDQNFIDEKLPPNQIGNNFEKLSDSLLRLRGERTVKKMYDKLTPVLKDQYDEATVYQKKRFANIASQFDTGDPVKDKKLENGFFVRMIVAEKDIEIRGKEYKKGQLFPSGQVGGFKKLDDLLKKMEEYLEAVKNEGLLEFYALMEKCNKKFGVRGCTLLFDEKGILVVEVKSWLANKMLNSHTKHCIVTWEYQWDTYVTRTDGRQYYFYNYNIIDDESVIGVTVVPTKDGEGTISAAHKKSDTRLGEDVRGVLKKWENEWKLSEDLNSYLQPMSEEEIALAKLRREAEMKLTKPNLSLEEIENYVMDLGANPNVGEGQALANAIDERNLDKISLLLDLGADPDARPNYPLINRLALGENEMEKIGDPSYQSQMFEIVKLLVKKGCKITPTVGQTYYSNYEAMKFFLENGMDPNIDNAAPMRFVIKGNFTKQNYGSVDQRIYDLLIEWGADPTIPIVSKWATQYGRIEMLEIIFEAFKKKNKQSMLPKLIDDLVRWLKSSPSLDPQTKETVREFLVRKKEELEGGSL